MTVSNTQSRQAGFCFAAAKQTRAAFTLLEVILALGLAVIVIGLVGNTVNSTLKFIDRGREKTERDQLARAVLAKIAGDVRGVVRYEPFDPSGMMSVKSSSKSSKSGSSSSKSGSGSTGKSGSTGGTDSTGGSSSSSSSSSSSTSGDSSTTATTTTIAGVYGSQYYLQVDVGRLPHVYEYAAMDSGTSTAPPTDVHSVSYYMAESGGAPAGTLAPTSTTLSGTGLVRTELDRSTALFTSLQGGTPESEGAAAIIAPEIVAIDFQYFDGTSWLFDWDSTTSGGLPQSIKITVALSNPAAGTDAATAATVADAATQDPDSVYSVVVLLPARDPISASGGAASSSSSDSSTTGSSSSKSGSSTGGSSTGGGSTGGGS